MNRYQLFRALRRHRILSERRAMNYEQNKAAKFVIWFSASFTLLYLVFIAVILSLIANDSRGTTPMEFMFGAAPIILLLDFSTRFLAQQTPAQIAKPYQLMPIPRYACVDALIASSMLTGYNFVWFAMLVPYAIMSIVFAYGFWLALLFLLMWWLMIMANSQWFLICKTLTTDTLLWWLLPAGVYALMGLPIILKLGAYKGWEQFFELYGAIGTLTEQGNPLPLIGIVALLAVLVLTNRRIQYTHVRNELIKTEASKKHKVSQMAALDRFGETGLYLKLELKTILRNKNPRKSFIMSVALVLVLSLIISMTDIYDNSMYTNFWGLYNYLIFGSIGVMRIMSNEGNYIDGLMIHKENLLCSFKTKYYLYCIILLWPFLLMLPTVIAGKWSLYMLVSYGIFTAGFQYFILFQMAIYNRQTLPLNTKFVGKGGLQTNYVQLVAGIGVYLVPMILVSVLQSAFSDTVGYTVMMVIGLAFIATHKWWLRNIYNRWMKRRYDIMAALRASR